MDGRPTRNREVTEKSPKASEEIEALHRRCGVYTKAKIVRRILDAVRWTADVDLSNCRLLEPAAGDGAFLEEAVRRLVTSFAKHDVPLTTLTLRDRITAFELHPREARRARDRVVETLCGAGVARRTAEVCARSWVIEGDFLLADSPLSEFSHVVGNPPYVRWSRIPPGLKKQYEEHLSPGMAGGDLFLPFLDRSLESTSSTGRCGFICSDRWRYMAFAEAFRRKWMSRVSIKPPKSIAADEAFEGSVASYPNILIMSKRSRTATKTRKVEGKTLAELGCTIKVGPALGHTPAYVLDDEDDVEPDLLRPWIDGAEIEEGKITWQGRRVITMYDTDGKSIDPKRFPRLKKRLERFRERLAQRSVVTNGAPWYQPIDRVRTEDWLRPKLLVPGIAKTPRLAIDRSGAIPSHGVYAIFAPDDDVDGIYEKLRDGKLAAALEGIAPRVASGFVRCYKRFLLMARFAG